MRRTRTKHWSGEELPNWTAAAQCWHSPFTFHSSAPKSRHIFHPPSYLFCFSPTFGFLFCFVFCLLRRVKYVALFGMCTNLYRLGWEFPRFLTIIHVSFVYKQLKYEAELEKRIPFANKMRAALGVDLCFLLVAFLYVSLSNARANWARNVRRKWCRPKILCQTMDCILRGKTGGLSVLYQKWFLWMWNIGDGGGWIGELGLR